MAFCLSGGVDSASLVSIAAKIFNKKVSTFSIIDEDPRYNEETNIIQTVKDINCENHLIRISKERNLDRLEQLIKYHDAPIATISYYLHSTCPKKCAKTETGLFFLALLLMNCLQDIMTIFYCISRRFVQNKLYLLPAKMGKTCKWIDTQRTSKNPDLYHSNPQFRTIFLMDQKLLMSI